MEMTEITDYKNIWRCKIRQHQSCQNGEMCTRQDVYFAQGQKYCCSDFFILHKLFLEKIIQRLVIIYQRFTIYHEGYLKKPEMQVFSS